MNEALRGDQADILEMFAPYIYQLMEGLNARKGYSGIVYRGIHLKSSLIKKYVKDSQFFWPGFTSCSMDPTVAMNWNSNCIFKIGIPKRFAHSCVDIEALSAFQKEKEVLVQPYCCYRVLDNKYDAQLSKHVITLLIEATCYNLSGIWTNHDTEHGVQNAGTYFIAQYGKDVFWFGRKDKAQWDFANVGHGTISCYVLFMHCSLFVHVSYRWKRFWISNQHKNNKMSHLGCGDGAVGDGNGADTLSITWSDLPIAKDRFSGELKLQIAADYLKMDKVADSSNLFWGNVWMKQSNMFLDDFAMDLSCKWKSDGGLSGIWKGNYGGIYIISTVKYGGSTQISWIALSEQMEWAHVAQGVIDRDRISVIWGDLLIGMDRYNGTLECVIKSMNEIIVKKSSPKGVL